MIIGFQEVHVAVVLPEDSLHSSMWLTWSLLKELHVSVFSGFGLFQLISDIPTTLMKVLKEKQLSLQMP